MREKITCEVVWLATIENLDGSGMPSGNRSSEKFDTKQEAEDYLRSCGLSNEKTKLNPYGWWRASYQEGNITRVLNELKDDKNCVCALVCVCGS